MNELELVCSGFGSAGSAGYGENKRIEFTTKTYEYIESISLSLNKQKKTFVEVGKNIKDFKDFIDTADLDFKGFKINDTWVQGNDLVFQEIMQEAFGLGKSSVYNYLKVYEMFNDTSLIEDYSLSQLTELSTLDKAELEQVITNKTITPSTSVRDIKQLKKDLKEQVVDVVVENIEKKNQLLHKAIMYFCSPHHDDISRLHSSSDKRDFLLKITFASTYEGVNVRFADREDAGLYEYNATKSKLILEADPSKVGYYRYEFDWKYVLKEFDLMLKNKVFGDFEKDKMTNEKIFNIFDEFMDAISDHLSETYTELYEEHKVSKRNMVIKGKLDNTSEMIDFFNGLLPELNSSIKQYFKDVSPTWSLSYVNEVDSSDIDEERGLVRV